MKRFILLLTLLIIGSCSYVQAQSYYSKGIIYSPGSTLPDGSKQEYEVFIKNNNSLIEQYGPDEQLIQDISHKVIIETLTQSKTVQKSNDNRLEIFNNTDNNGIGVQRLAKIMSDRYNENTGWFNVQKIDNTHYTLTIVSTHQWAMGTWEITIKPDSLENRLVNKNEFWYGYYDHLGNKLGICIARKI